MIPRSSVPNCDEKAAVGFRPCPATSPKPLLAIPRFRPYIGGADGNSSGCAAFGHPGPPVLDRSLEEAGRTDGEASRNPFDELRCEGHPEQRLVISAIRIRPSAHDNSAAPVLGAAVALRVANLCCQGCSKSHSRSPAFAKLS